MWKLISLVGQDDADILPHFLEHYRSLGIGELNVFLHGTWTGANLAPLRSADVVIAGVLPAGADVDVTSSALDAYTRRFEDEWVVIVEPDEFLELPYETLEQTVAALQSLGADELPATVLQRAAPDGRLAALSGEARPSEVFPCYDFRLAERMDGPEPIRKTKYPLVRVATGLRLPGNAHLPHTGRASAYHPIRGVLHHYHWRDRLSGAVGQGQLRIADQYEHDAYRRWLEAHDFCVPAEGLRRYSRKALFHEGHLICPTVRQSEASAALEQCRLSHWGAAEELSNAERQVAAIPNAVAQVDEGAAAYLDRRWLLTPPGRIALVTIELQGMYRSGGIGTAMAALAERLSSAGHEVHVVYCPFIGPPSLEARWVEYWSARGVRIHYLPIFKDQNRHTPPDELALKVADLLQSNEWDVIHFHETCGLGAAALLLRSAGLAFQDSRIVVTAHGPTTWHRRGNSLAWNRQEALHVLLESICVEFADVIVCPSAYMVEWLQKNLPSPVSRVVVPNCLTGESRRFGRVPAERRSVRKIVFFGRLEFRKGIDLFADAVDRVLASGFHDFEVVLLGRAEGEMAGQLTARIANWACKTTHVANYASHDAVDLLRTEDCLAVLPSRADNLPYTVYECLENGIPFIASAIGGIPEMIREEDRERVLVHGGAEAYAARIIDALTNGFVPAQARFDPTLAEIDLLALHGRLVNDARSLRGGASPATSEATVIVHGADPLDLEGPLARLLWGWARDGVEIVAAADLLSEAAATRLALRGPPVPLADSVGGAALNGLARSATGERLLFCHTSVVPHEGALTAMLTALENTGADAVVCGYEEVDATGKPRAIAVFAGPAELSASENVYGARLMLVRKESFLQAGGFAEEMGLAPIVEWEFLNRLKAGGKRVVGVPLPLAGRSSAPSPELTESGRARLALPWITAAPVNMQGFLAMSLHQAGQPGRRKAAQPNLRLPPEQTPESAGLSRAVSARDAQPSVPTTILDRLPGRAGPQTLHVAATEPSAAEGADIDLSRDDQPPHSRIGRDGRLLDGSVTYVVSAAEDAEACDFLVADGLLGRDQCKTLAKTFRSLAGRLFNGSAPRGNLFLWLDEIAAADPSAGRTIADALERAATLTRDFYGIDGPIYPVRSRIVEVPAGRFIPPPARALGSVNGSGPFGYAGGIRLNQDFEGGESYFPALDIAVKPKRGRLMTAAADPQHEHAVLRVTSGAQLMMTFCLTSMPRDASDSVKRTVYS